VRANITVRNNTITGNSVGIQCNPSQSSTITNNNIQDNSQYNFRSETAKDIIAINNWWGTTDSSSINRQSMFNKYDFNLGTVTFIPFLTAPNPEAPPMPTPTPSATPTSTPTQSPSSSPSLSQNPTASPAIPQIGLNEIEVAILIVLIVIVALLIVIIGLVLRKGR
jgi:parallel beta-helix repeat protein